MLEPLPPSAQGPAWPPVFNDGQVKVFYDDVFPLCMREICLLRRLDKRARIRFTDISSKDYQAEDYGRTLDPFMSEIHERPPEGTWVQGAEVSRRLYAAVA